MRRYLLLTFLLFFAMSCSSSGSSDNNGGSSDDRSSLPTNPPAFATSPMQFTAGIETDLYSFGVYNLTSDCDVVHFITFSSETYPQQWLNVSKGDTVTAGEIIGYLPKVSGNFGENLIHIDWIIGTGSSQSNYVCPTSYFSTDWQNANIPLLANKIQSQCVQVCYE